MENEITITANACETFGRTICSCIAGKKSFCRKKTLHDIGRDDDCKNPLTVDFKRASFGGCC